MAHASGSTHRGRGRRRLAILLLGALLVPLCGCAITTVGADGTREVFVFVHMKLPRSTPAGALAGETMELNVVGLLVYSSPVGAGLALGYAKEQVTGLKNNVLVSSTPECKEPSK